MANLGAAIVEIRGNLAPLNATLDAARSNSASFTAQTEQHMERVAGSLSKIRAASASASASFDKLVADAKRSGASLSAALDQGFNVGKISASARASADAFVSEFKRIEAAADHAAGAWSRLGAAGSANLNAIRTNRTLAEQNAEAARRLGALGSTGSNVIPFARPATRDKKSLQDSTMIGAQLSDFGVQVASGQGWLMPLIQQGSQLQFQLGDRGLKGAVKSLGTGFLELATNPLALTIAGLAAAGTAAQYFWNKANAGVEDVQTTLEKHASTIGMIREAWGEAGRAAQEYAPPTGLRVFAEMQANEVRLRAAALAEGKSAIDKLFSKATDMTGEELFAANPTFAPIIKEVEAFRKSVQAGRPDFKSLLDTVDALFIKSPNDSKLADLRKQVQELAKEGDKAQRALQALANFSKSTGLDALLGALPAPPLVPYITASDGWRPSPLPVIRPALALVRSQPRISARPTVRVPEQRSHEQLRAVHPSSPPSAPPPSPAMRRVA